MLKLNAIRAAAIAGGAMAVLATAGVAQAQVAPTRGVLNPFTLTTVAPSRVVAVAPVVNVPATPMPASGNAPIRGGYTAPPPPSVVPPPRPSAAPAACKTRRRPRRATLADGHSRPSAGKLVNRNAFAPADRPGRGRFVFKCGPSSRRAFPPILQNDAIRQSDRH